MPFLSPKQQCTALSEGLFRTIKDHFILLHIVKKLMYRILLVTYFLAGGNVRFKD